MTSSQLAIDFAPRSTRRRVLVTAEPLSSREPSAWVRTLLAEYAAALSCERRARCHANKRTMSGEERRQVVLDQMADAQRRMAVVEMQLVSRMRV